MSSSLFTDTCVELYLNPPYLMCFLGRKCRYIFYNQTAPVVPAFKDKSNAAGVRIDMRLNELPKMISLKEKHTTCTAGSINEITSTGSTKLLDPNDDSGFFEVQHVYHPKGGYKSLTVSTLSLP